MNLYIYFAPLLFLMIIFAIATIVLTAIYFHDKNEHGWTWRKNWYFYIFCSFSSFLGLFSWIIVAGNQPWEITSEDQFVIKDIIYPDETKVQMFSYNGNYFNVTQMTGKIFDKEEWIVKRTNWKEIYCGVSYSGISDRLTTRNRYYFEKKEGKEQSLLYSGIYMEIPVKEDNEKSK